MRKILIFVPVYLPGYKAGGPIRTVSNMISALGDYFDFYVICQDRDIDGIEPFIDVDYSHWVRVGKASVLYVKPGLAGLKKLCQMVFDKKFSVVHFNSFFSFRFSIFPLIIISLFQRNKLVLVGPRGEFSVGALLIKSIKKYSFIRMVRFAGFYNHVTWHASTEHEADDIRRVMGKNATIRIATDIACPIAGIEMSFRQSNSPLRIIFLSRISIKKNLFGAIGYLQKVKVPVVFDVYGPIEDSAYWSECEAAVINLPGTVKFNYRGSLFPSQVPDVLSKYDLFLLPTMGENFGHAIAEALGAGLPVLISDQTPWRDLSQKSLGWDLPLNNSLLFIECIENCYRIPADEYNSWRVSIREWALMNIGNDEAVDQSRRLFMNLHGVI